MKTIVVMLIAAVGMFPALSTRAQSVSTPAEVHVEWSKVEAVSRLTPTLQVVVNPELLRGSKLHDKSFSALHELGADYVRYVPWLPYPKQAVAELEPPRAGKTSWNFSYIDPTLDDFMKATAGHPVVMNFSTLPAWMFKTPEPVTYPADPNQVFWKYTQGTELRDPTMHEPAEYLARLLSWYTKGGLTDEHGKWHESGHHYKIAYWEVLNEIDLEHQWTPESYTKFYHTVVAEMRKVDPQIKFVGIALANVLTHEHMFEYFLNPANHAPGIPLDFISYHFYASPPADQPTSSYSYTFFDQAHGFVGAVRLVEEIRKRYTPATRTNLDEVGVILPEDIREIDLPGYVAKDEPEGYWNLAGAMYAYLYAEFAAVGIDVIGESQLVGYKSQFPSVSMMDYKTGEPNARFWVLKMLKDNFGPGDRLVATETKDDRVKVQAFETHSGRKLLVINKRLTPLSLALPKEFANGQTVKVAPSTGDRPPAVRALSGSTLDLEPAEVVIVSTP